MTTSDPSSTPQAVDSVTRPEVRRVILASSLGTIFEWYDFYLYAVLTPVLAGLFFPKENETAALVGAFVGYAAGFLVRPFGALVFGRIGDLVGRKYTFLITITIMGASTFAVGLLPKFATVGWLAPILLGILRLVQGLAIGGEYGGAATYVAEHSPNHRRGYITSWIQTTATVGLLLALMVILLCRTQFSDATFKDWGWRIPFLVSAILLAFSIYIRLKLNESPVFRLIKSENRASKSPLADSFLRYPNNKYVLLALLGATAGQGVVWYTGQFQALYFLGTTLKVDYVSTYLLIAGSLVIGTPLFLVFGRLSDRIGRLKIILAGFLLAAITYFPIFHGLTHYANPALEAFQDKTTITLAADEATCGITMFRSQVTKDPPCGSTKSFLTSLGVQFDQVAEVAGSDVVLTIADKGNAGVGDIVLKGWDKAKTFAALKAKGYPAGDAKVPEEVKANTKDINYVMVLLLLTIMVVYVTMVYAPIAAYLVELFPANIRYTSMSLPYHIGNGWFGGMLPLTFTLLVASSGNIYQGLWYPIIVAVMSLIVGAVFLRETRKNFDIQA